MSHAVHGAGISEHALLLYAGEGGCRGRRRGGECVRPCREGTREQQRRWFVWRLEGGSAALCHSTPMSPPHLSAPRTTFGVVLEVAEVV